MTRPKTRPLPPNLATPSLPLPVGVAGLVVRVPLEPALLVGSALVGGLVGADEVLAGLVVEEDEDGERHRRGPVIEHDVAGKEALVKARNVREGAAEQRLGGEADKHDLVLHALVVDRQDARLANDEVCPLHDDDRHEGGGLRVAKGLDALVARVRADEGGFRVLAVLRRAKGAVRAAEAVRPVVRRPLGLLAGAVRGHGLRGKRVPVVVLRPGHAEVVAGHIALGSKE
mmetsp:Transcript_9288/g.21958  ORF Transcript_9288/g.21958 Transcript_9288/m.21958 type:complete len:229 (+) Transcript_9288:264-950(+)